MHHLTAFAGLLVMPTHTWTEAFALLLRWVHFLAGITWIGLLYFFNLVNVPFMKQVDAGMKPKVFQYMTLPTLQLFRWSALLTVFVGFWYWAQMYVAVAAHNAGVSPAGTIGLFLLIWIVSWGILYFVVLKTPPGYVVGLVTTVVVIVAAWLFVKFTPVGQDDPWPARRLQMQRYWRARRSWLRGRISFSPCQCCSLWPPVHTTRYWGVEALPEPESRCADTCFHTKNVGLATGP